MSRTALTDERLLTEREFRERVIEMLTELRTKMGLLFGDGNGQPGQFQAVQALVAAHEKSLTEVKARRDLAGAIRTALLSIFGATIGAGATLIAHYLWR